MKEPTSIKEIFTSIKEVLSLNKLTEALVKVSPDMVIPTITYLDGFYSVTLQWPSNHNEFVHKATYDRQIRFLNRMVSINSGNKGEL